MIEQKKILQMVILSGPSFCLGCKKLVSILDIKQYRYEIKHPRIGFWNQRHWYELMSEGPIQRSTIIIK